MCNYTTIKINLKINIKDKNKYRYKTKQRAVLGFQLNFLSNMPIEKKKKLKQ